MIGLNFKENLQLPVIFMKQHVLFYSF